MPDIDIQIQAVFKTNKLLWGGVVGEDQQSTSISWNNAHHVTVVGWQDYRVRVALSAL